MNKEQVIKDLNDIKVYSSHKHKYKLDGLKSYVTKLLEKYNNVVAQAPVKLFEFYMLYYLTDTTLLDLSFDINKSMTYLQNTKNGLIEYLVGNLKE